MNRIFCVAHSFRQTSDPVTRYQIQQEKYIISAWHQSVMCVCGECRIQVIRLINLAQYSFVATILPLYIADVRRVWCVDQLCCMLWQRDGDFSFSNSIWRFCVGVNRNYSCFLASANRKSVNTFTHIRHSTLSGPNQLGTHANKISDIKIVVVSRAMPTHSHTHLSIGNIGFDLIWLFFFFLFVSVQLPQNAIMFGSRVLIVSTILNDHENSEAQCTLMWAANDTKWLHNIDEAFIFFPSDSISYNISVMNIIFIGLRLLLSKCFGVASRAPSIHTIPNTLRFYPVPESPSSSSALR